MLLVQRKIESWSLLLASQYKSGKNGTEVNSINDGKRRELEPVSTDKS